MENDIIQDLLYNQAIGDVVTYLSSCDKSVILHLYGYNYNWDNGLETPLAIVENPECSLGTALTIFYLADGYRYLTEKSETSNTSDWQAFVSKLYNHIISGYYSDTSIAFQLPLSKVQIFKLKKLLNENEQIFVTPIDGENFDISL